MFSEKKKVCPGKYLPDHFYPLCLTACQLLIFKSVYLLGSLKTNHLSLISICRRGKRGSFGDPYLFLFESFQQGSRMVRKEGEREMGSSVGVWHLHGFIVAVLFQLCLFEAFPTYEHATDKIPWMTGWLVGLFI